MRVLVAISLVASVMIAVACGGNDANTPPAAPTATATTGGYPPSYPTGYPTGAAWYPNAAPTGYPTASPTGYPTPAPTAYPTAAPTASPTAAPTATGTMATPGLLALPLSERRNLRPASLQHAVRQVRVPVSERGRLRHGRSMHDGDLHAWRRVVMLARSPR
jgi:hypothetical protein